MAVLFYIQQSTVGSVPLSCEQTCAGAHLPHNRRMIFFRKPSVGGTFIAARVRDHVPHRNHRASPREVNGAAVALRLGQGTRPRSTTVSQPVVGGATDGAERRHLLARRDRLWRDASRA